MAWFGVVFIVLGVWLVVSALANWDWFYGILEFGIVEMLFGESAGRLVCLLVGIVLIVGGVAGLLTWH